MPTQTIDFNEVQSVYFNGNSVNEVVFNDEIIFPLAKPQELWVTIEATEPFRLSVASNVKRWDGTIYYVFADNYPNFEIKSNQGWAVWNPTQAASREINVYNQDESFYKDGKYRVFLRGVGNTFITGNGASSSSGAWRVESLGLVGRDIKIKGDIGYLMDWEYYYTHDAPEPLISEYAFASWWAFPTNATISEKYCIHDASELILPYATLLGSTYRSMFFNHQYLTLPPSLKNITTLDQNGDRHCYGMFYKTRITKLPKLEAKYLPAECYMNMFYQCPNIFLSQNQSETYRYLFKIPNSDSSTGAGFQCVKDMFYDIGAGDSPFVGTPNLNQYYYSRNEII